MIGAVTALIIFGKMHFLLISENEFTHEIKCNGMTSFMDFKPPLERFTSVYLYCGVNPSEVSRGIMNYEGKEAWVVTTHHPCYKMHPSSSTSEQQSRITPASLLHPQSMLHLSSWLLHLPSVITASVGLYLQVYICGSAACLWFY